MSKYPTGSTIKKGNTIRKVLGEAGDVRFTSLDKGTHDYWDTIVFNYYTWQQLERIGWKVVEEEWVPEIGQKYWTFDLNAVWTTIMVEDIANLRHVEQFRIFRTEQEAMDAQRKTLEFIKNMKNI